MGDPAKLWRALDALDRKLGDSGFPRLSPWWRKTLERFIVGGKRQLVLRVGRRGGKSSSLCRLAVVFALYGEHKIPPGDLGIVAFISTTRDEANQRLRTIKAILDALGVAYRPIDGGIELADRPIGFKVFAASVSSVSGFTAILVIGDEVAKWKDADTGANPATEVLASVRPTMATQPDARMVLSSSPYSTMDAHYDAVEQGDTTFQMVEHAPTWTANQTITEAETHQLEPDERVWQREYAAIPQTEVEESLLTSTELDAVTRADHVELRPEEGHHYVAAMDPATRRDAWTLVIATRRRVELTVRKSVALCREWTPSKGAALAPDTVLSAIADICKTYRVTTVWTDQHAADALRAIARRFDLNLCEETITAPRKLALFEDLHTRILDGQVELPRHDVMRADLLNVRKRITRNGPSIELPRIGGRHCDFAPAVALAVDKYVGDPPSIPVEPPAYGSLEWWRPELKRLHAAAERRFGRSKDW